MSACYWLRHYAQTGLARRFLLILKDLGPLAGSRPAPAFPGRRTAARAASSGAQRGDVANVDIRGPVGIGGVHLEMRGTGGTPNLTLANQRRPRSSQSDAAWSGTAEPPRHSRCPPAICVTGCSAWPRRASINGTKKTENGVTTLEQGGWRIDYQRYSDEPGARVPMRITATSGDARVRIVVDRWQLGQ